MRDVESSVDGAFEASEDLGAGGSVRQPDVEITSEGSRLSVNVLHGIILTIGFRDPRVDLIQTKLAKKRKTDY